MIIKINKIQIIILILFFIGSQSLSPGCYLPTGRSGICIPISQCVYMQNLIANLQKPLPSDVSLLIRESFFCGSDRGTVSVCCPLDGLGNRLADVPTILDKNKCQFQDHKEASCVKYSQCLPFAHLIGNLKKPILPAIGSIVRSAYMCGFNDQTGNVVPKVCCPSDGFIAEEVMALSLSTTEEETENTTEEPIPIKPEDLKDHPGRKYLANEYSCGISLVINRKESNGIASIGQYPWLVLLGYQERGSKRISYKCGGILIGSQFVVTSAECVSKSNPIVVRAGEHNQATLKDCGLDNNICSDELQDIQVDQVIAHPNFKNNKPWKNNIAIIKLASGISENDFVSAICLNFDTIKNKDKIVQTDSAGWGSSLNQKRKRPSPLHFISVNTTSSDNCPNTRSSRRQSANGKTICIAALNDQDFCLSDSGGGLMRNILSQFGEQWYLMGVAADMMCSTRVAFRPFTSMDNYIGWILETVNNISSN